MSPSTAVLPIRLHNFRIWRAQALHSVKRWWRDAAPPTPVCGGSLGAGHPVVKEWPNRGVAWKCRQASDFRTRCSCLRRRPDPPQGDICALVGCEPRSCVEQVLSGLGGLQSDQPNPKSHWQLNLTAIVLAHLFSGNATIEYGDQGSDTRAVTVQRSTT